MKPNRIETPSPAGGTWDLVESCVAKVSPGLSIGGREWGKEREREMREREDAQGEGTVGVAMGRSQFSVADNAIHGTFTRLKECACNMSFWWWLSLRCVFKHLSSHAVLLAAAMCLVDPTNNGRLGRAQCYGANAVRGNLQQSRVLGVASTLFLSVMDGERGMRGPPLRFYFKDSVSRTPAFCERQLSKRGLEDLFSSLVV